MPTFASALVLSMVIEAVTEWVLPMVIAPAVPDAEEASPEYMPMLLLPERTRVNSLSTVTEPAPSELMPLQ